MRIEKLTIDQKELCEAVGAWLKTKGVSLEVKNVEKNYLGSGFKVDLAVEPEPETQSNPEVAA